MTPIINLSHISYNYEEVSALNDISLEIYAGELIFLQALMVAVSPLYLSF